VAASASCTTTSTTVAATAANTNKLRALQQQDTRLHQQDEQLIAQLRAAETAQSPDLMETLAAEKQAVLHQIGDVEQQISRLEQTPPGTTVVPCVKK
jgi:hypothetical protein